MQTCLSQGPRSAVVVDRDSLLQYINPLQSSLETLPIDAGDRALLLPHHLRHIRPRCRYLEFASPCPLHRKNDILAKNYRPSFFLRRRFNRKRRHIVIPRTANRPYGAPPCFICRLRGTQLYAGTDADGWKQRLPRRLSPRLLCTVRRTDER